MRSEKEIKEAINHEKEMMNRENKICKELKRSFCPNIYLAKIYVLEWVLGKPTFKDILGKPMFKDIEVHKS